MNKTPAIKSKIGRATTLPPFFKEQMESTFFISIRAQTPDDIVPLARFSIGKDRPFADKLYDELQGSADDLNDSPLLMEWTEEQEGLPLNLRLKGCTLKQVACNCESITRELFKRHTLG